jgi:DNA-binding response OmpR family regulator
MRLLLVEDNERMGPLLKLGLEESGFVVDWLPTAEQARDALQNTQYDLIILDLGLPDTDGLTLLKSIRRAGTMTPVLVATARGGLNDKIAGLDSGADDYIVKPFAVPELAARCRALLRRPGHSLPAVITFGNLSLDTGTRTFQADGNRLELSPREAAILEVLLRRAGQVVPKSSIETAIYNLDKDVSANAVEAAVSRLRKRQAAGQANVEIRTAHGIGYVLMTPTVASPEGPSNVG